MDHVGEPLGKQVFGRQAGPSHVVHRDRRDTVQALFTRQHKNGRETLTRLNRDVNRRILAPQNDDAVNVEGREVVAQLPVGPVGVGQGHVVARLRGRVEDRQQHRAVPVEHGRGQDDLEHVRALGRQRTRRIVGHVPQLLDKLGDPRPRLFGDLGVAAHDARDGVGGHAGRARDVGQRYLLRRSPVCGHRLMRLLR